MDPVHCRLALTITPLVLLSFAQPAASQQMLVEDFRFGDFTSAERIAADPFGTIYVSDGSEHCIQTFDSSGRPLRRIGGYGWGTDQFDHPSGIDAHLGIAVYVADKGNHHIVRMDRSLSIIGAFSTRDDPNQTIAFGYPLDVAISNTGNLYILDGENRRVVMTTGFAAIDNAFGGVESGTGRLQEPVSLALSLNDDVHVLERSRVAVFDLFGSYLFEYGSGRIHDASGIGTFRDLTYVVLPGALLVFRSDGTLVREFPSSAFAFAEPISEFRDVVVQGDRLYLLTAKTVIALKP